MIEICEKCFSTELKNKNNKYICKYCNSKTFQCDDLVVDSIILLNKNNIKTKFSCEGHFQSNNIIHMPYITFEKYNEKLINKLSKYLIQMDLVSKIDINKIEEGLINTIFVYSYEPKTINQFNKWKIKLWEYIYKFLNEYF